jgi:hypothetical protein
VGGNNSVSTIGQPDYNPNLHSEMVYGKTAHTFKWVAVDSRHSSFTWEFGRVCLFVVPATTLRIGLIGVWNRAQIDVI